MNRFYLSFCQGILFLILSAGAIGLSAQTLQVTSGNTAPYTPQNLISNIFLGEGVEVTSITYGGNANAVGYFNNGNQSIGIERGIVLTSGVAETSGFSLGCNENGTDFASTDHLLVTSDPDLAAVATAALHDLAIYTIKFIPTSDTLRFRYCFASEEYPEYACSPFNDVFGFFIQGPGYAVPTNIAKVPGTNLAVSINNVHPANGGGCPAKNLQYYNNNNNSNKQPTYDGFTDVFTAQAIVTPCEEYTIKLAIADVSDGVFDSGVFLEAKSFGTGSLKVEVATVGADATLTEGCADGTLTFSLPTPAVQNFPIDYNVWGTATTGVDYQTIPTGLFIPAGQTQISVPLISYSDNLVENGEYIAVDVKRDPCHRDTIYIQIRDNSILPPTLRPDTTVCQSHLVPLTVNGTLPITLPPPPSFSNTQDFNVAPVNSFISSPITVSGLIQKKIEPGVIRSVCMNIDHPFDDDLDIFLFSPAGQFVELSTDNGKNGKNYTNTCFTPDAAQVISFPGPQAPASAAPFTGDFLPEGPWTDLYGDHPTNGAWKLQVRDDANGFTGMLKDWTITFEPAYKLTYQWSPTDSVACPTCAVTTINPSQTTVYTLTATDSYGCIVKDSVEVEVLPALPAPVISCGNSSTSTLSFDWAAVPGATGYQVNVNNTGWITSSDSLSHTVSGLVPNTSVGIQVQAIGGLADCTPFIGSATCVNCQSPIASVAATGVTCAGSANGTLIVTPDGLNPPYSFEVDAQTNTNGNFQNLAAGNYTVTVTDPGGCQGYFPFTVSTPSAIVPAISVQQDVLCFGGNTAVINTNASGGTGAFTYLWNDASGQTTPKASSLTAGTYIVTVTDANGCTAVDTASVVQPPDLTASTMVTDAACFNQASGAILAAAAGGVFPYSYLWTGGPSTELNDQLVAGSYTVTVTDANGCTETTTATVGQPTQLTATATTVSAKCSSSADGTANVLPQGGTLPYTYLWSDGQTAASATGLTAQTYQVTVTDGHGCVANQSAAVSAPPPLAVNVTRTNASCNSLADGTATATTTGGTAPYTYHWSDAAGQSSAVASALVAGNYSVTVTDANGCTIEGGATIGEPGVIQVTATAVNALCFGSATGKVNVAVQGGTAPFTYAWNSGDLSQNITQKAAGLYSVTVTDGHGCTGTTDATVGQATEIQWTSTEKSILCKGGNDGGIAVTATGGTPGYNLNWTGPGGFTGSGTNLQNLLAGAYTATLTDAAGCTQTVAQNVTEPATALALTLPAFADTICFAASNGQATVAVTGGTPPYAYLWDAGGQTTATAFGLSSQPYNVTVTDHNNCAQTAATFVIQKQELSAFASTDDPLCYNGKDGKARVTVAFYGINNADLSALHYLWSTTPTQTQLEATGLSANTSYTVTVVDAQGCTAERSVEVGNPYPVVGRIDSLANVRCFGDSNGWAVASGSGGTAPYTYFWSPGPTNQTDSLAQNLHAGTYRVTVTDAHGCPSIETATITEPSQLKMDLFKTDVACFGGQDGTVKAVVAGGIPPYAYLWQGGQLSPDIKQLPAGTFGLTLSDANGCLQHDSITVAEPATAVSGTAAFTPPHCFGGYDGFITLTGAGGSPPYRYALDQGAWNGSTRQIGLRAGTYQPKIIDAHGCTVTLDPVEIDQPAAVQVDLGPDIVIELGRDTQLLATVTNAMGQVLFQWTAADSVWLNCLDCDDPLVEGLLYQHFFEVSVTDTSGCQARDQVLVKVEKPRRVFVPTGFTPNDDLNNDHLLVHGQPSAHILDFRIYDRWGELVFEQKDFALNDETAGWDGNFRGHPVDPGVYAWVLEVLYMDGEKEVLKGSTTLIR